ncbi:acetyl-CoA carboxylase biotin carboxyl carrier protein subunit [Flavobacterium cellulosilyticum]|uniref:Acetyl-CoA carboxylase biotin carboxyl carrier protein subunit n=1 Tax=Flavobacterium cellulosilyticum TaxID=2541731 RepID=A0A4R5CJ67_9FLAO|nr:acetyl-CoA carboxylase biotin carboxyl carrier protein subunit [Flavobacterium cellulosilyticum]TDD97422.1 acetyl-CoA carboxylase biotin carboxyl carrier protein subunit [Flavobacterium cellulosilyticum]
MTANFKVKVNGAFEFDFNKDSVSQLDAVPIEINQFHVLHQNLPYKAEIVVSDFNQKKYTIKVNSSIYHVVISDPLDQLIKEMGFETGLAKQINDIKAPMPGLILEINVIIGQTVKENDPLLILTAMKMENSYHSPRDGIIKSIAVNVGDSVIKGDLLIEFE